MRRHSRLTALVVGLILAAAPTQALRRGPDGESPAAARASGGDVSRGWYSDGFGGVWSWIQSLFDEDHGGIVP